MRPIGASVSSAGAITVEPAIVDDGPCTEEGLSAQCIDAMGYHDAREIPNYWTYAQNFVLQDNMYEAMARGAASTTTSSRP